VIGKAPMDAKIVWSGKHVSHESQKDANYG